MAGCVSLATGYRFLFTYKNIIPIWNDINFLVWDGMLSRDVCWQVLAALRRVRAVDLSNCHGVYQRLLCIHNGRIENFRHTLYRPLRDVW